MMYIKNSKLLMGLFLSAHASFLLAVPAESASPTLQQDTLSHSPLELEVINLDSSSPEPTIVANSDRNFDTSQDVDQKSTRLRS